MQFFWHIHSFNKLRRLALNFLLSLTSTDYILSIVYLNTLGETTSNTNRLYCTPLTRIVVELSFQAQLLIVYYHNVQDLTLHHLIYFFCFRHHHTYTIFSLRYYVVVILALRVPSNSVSLLHSFAPCLHTSFPICLLKFSCNSSHDKVAIVLALFNKMIFPLQLKKNHS